MRRPTLLHLQVRLLLQRCIPCKLQLQLLLLQLLACKPSAQAIGSGTIWLLLMMLLMMMKQQLLLLLHSMHLHGMLGGTLHLPVHHIMLLLATTIAGKRTAAIAAMAAPSR